MHVCAEENSLYVYELPQGYHEAADRESVGRPITRTAIRRTSARDGQDVS